MPLAEESIDGEANESALGDFLRRKGAEEQAKYSKEPAIEESVSEIDDEWVQENQCKAKGEGEGQKEGEGEEDGEGVEEGDGEEEGEEDSGSCQSDRSAEFREHEKFIIDLSNQILNGDDKDDLFGFEKEDDCQMVNLDLAMSYSDKRIEEFTLKKSFPERESPK